MTFGEGILLAVGIVALLGGILASYDGWQMGPSLCSGEDEPDKAALMGLKIVGIVLVVFGVFAVQASLRHQIQP